MTHRNLRAAQKEKTRRRVLKKAMAVCARSGFHEARTLDVARAAGLSHGALFVHFPSREDMLAEVAAQMGREITDRLHALARNAATLRQALSAHIECLEKYENLYRHFLLEAPGAAPRFRLAWTGIQSAVSTHLEKAVERERQAGRVRSVPQHLLFNTWIGLVNHYVIHKDLFSPRRSVLKEHGPALIEHFITLLAK